MKVDEPVTAPSPHHLQDLDHGLVSALRGLAARRRILIALDFDGVLAPFVDDPRLAAPLPRSVRALHRLARHPRVGIGYISGRPLADLKARTQAPGAALFVGSHGAEMDLGTGSVESLELSPAEQATLNSLTTAMEAAVRESNAGRLEVKPGGIVLHTRGLDEGIAQRLYRRAEQIAESFPAVKFSVGHQVAEFAIRHADKGQGLTALREQVLPEAVLFAGDDTTDEDAFAVLRPENGDVGVKVGPGDTAAEYRVGDPEGVGALLDRLADVLDETADD